MSRQADTPDLSAIRRDMQGVYERQAGVWHGRRMRDLNERKWLDPFLASLPPQPRVLDLGCGSGVPLGAYLLAQGCDVTGVDYSSAMIALARENVPSGHWQVQDMRTLDLEGDFDGIVSWDAFFHLSQNEQRELLPTLGAMVRDGGALLLTVGPGSGEVTGTVGGETVYHASLSPDEYRSGLKGLGFTDIKFVPEDPDVMGRSVLLATGKRA